MTSDAPDPEKLDPELLKLLKEQIASEGIDSLVERQRAIDEGRDSATYRNYTRAINKVVEFATQGEDQLQTWCDKEGLSADGLYAKVSEVLVHAWKRLPSALSAELIKYNFNSNLTTAVFGLVMGAYTMGRDSVLGGEHQDLVDFLVSHQVKD